MTITPSQILNARAVPVAEGQLDLFATEAETVSEHTSTDPDACPADCPCRWAAADTGADQ